MQFPLPANEDSRLETLLSYEILDTETEQVFDDLALLATTICATPMATIGFIDADRLWLKARFGLPVTEIAREDSLCAHTILQNEPLIVEDTLADERFAANPFVTCEPAIRFYAGAPLIAPDGHALGAVCVMDHLPRTLQPQQVEALLTLSRRVTDRLELRRQVANATKYKQIEDALRQSEVRYRTMVETATDVIVTTDEAGTILFVNNSVERVFGYTADELKGAQLTMLLPGYLSRLREAGMSHYLAPGQSHPAWQSAKLDGLHQSGTELPLEVSLGVFLENAKLRITSIIRDVSERERIAAILLGVTESLSESVERFQQLTESIREVFWLSEAGKPGLIYVSPAYEEVWGRSCESLSTTPHSWFEAVHPEDRERIGEAVRAKQPRGDYDEEYRIIRPDGSLRWIQDRAFPIKNAAGEVYRIAGVAADITSRKQAEERLRESEEHYRALVNQTISGIAETDLTGRFTQVNDRYCEIAGYTREELLGGMRMQDITHSDDLPRNLELFQCMARAGASFEIEKRYVRKHGSHVWVLNSVSAIRDASGKPQSVVAIVVDVTGRKRTDEALRRAHDELEQRVAERTQQLSMTLSALQAEEAARKKLLHRIVMAHEEERRRIARELHDKMGQSLTMLIWGLNSLKDDAQDQAATRPRLDGLLEVAVELAQEAHHLAWELRPAALDHLGLQSALANYLAQWSERAKISVDFHSADLDRHRLSPEIEMTLYRVIQEALTNVLKHAHARRVSVIVDTGANDVQVIVEDDGKGFAVGRSRCGSNQNGHLGLVGMQERVAMVAGTLDIESTPGQGTTVFVRIPVPFIAQRAAAHE